MSTPSTNQPAAPEPAPGRPPEAVQRRSRLSLIWLIPLVAALIAAYLGYQTLSTRGPLVTLTFRSAQGLTAGQTKVRHKAVDLGTVQAITLSPDMSHVVVQVQMTREATPYLTENTRFWVVRPRLTAGNISGLDTVLSGSYLEMDPGNRDAKEKRDFAGLEQPPGIRSDEPGRTYTLKASRIGALGPGAPVLFRDTAVGEVLNYDLGDGSGPATIQVFVREPYDRFVKDDTHFWNASGVTVSLGAEGVHVELTSIQAVLSGGVAFDTPPADSGSKVSGAGREFTLYDDFGDAKAARYVTQYAFVSYFNSDVRGLARNAPVELYGIQVGVVRDIALQVDAATGTSRVRVAYEVQPERFGAPDPQLGDVAAVATRMVGQGLRAELKTSSYLTGQLVVSMQYVPGAGPVAVPREGAAIVIPSQGGGLDNILTAVSDFSAKLQRLPLDQIGDSLNSALRSASGALASVEGLVKKTDAGLTPTLRSLPQLTATLQDAVGRAGRVFGSLDASYGSNSSFNRELERAMAQIGDTARSVRVLADFLDRHPEALLRGRAGLSQ